MKMWINWKSYTVLKEVYTGIPTLENYLVLYSKLEGKHTLCVIICTLNIYLRESFAHALQKISTRMFPAALFIAEGIKKYN